MLNYINLGVVGNNQHRSGWPYCLDALSPLFDKESPVIFDDFIERTFLYRNKRFNRVYDKPWVGVMHHPPDLPRWYMPGMTSGTLQRDKSWQQSIEQLQLMIVLSENVRTWFMQQYPHVPCVTIKHATGLPLLYWSPDSFLAKQRPKMMQVGWFLRNVSAINHVEMGDRFQRVKLVASTMGLSLTLKPCQNYYSTNFPHRKHHTDVEVVNWVPHDIYDVMMSECVVLMEVISAAANNTVVECIMRNTPLCINRHPGPEYYLGKNYPLFYDDFDDIDQVLTIDNILAAHQYLKAMDKWWITGNMFREQLQAACMQHVPECRVAVTLPEQVEACEF